VLLLAPSQMAPVAVQSAVPDASCRGHRVADGADAVFDPKVGLTGRYSLIQAEQTARDSDPLLLPRRVAQEVFHDAGFVGSIPARPQNKPAARALARRPLPLQTFYVVSVCLASIYACVAL
jgi:hypothetical protein